MIAGEVEVGRGGRAARAAERSVWRLKRRFGDEGPAGARPRQPRPGVAAADRRVRPASGSVALAPGRYDGANDTHLAELLAEHEGISLSRVERPADPAGGRHRQPTPAAATAPPQPARPDAPGRHAPAADGSRHDWLGRRGPRLTLVGAIDDATGIITGATFRDQEDAAGYLVVLRDTVRRHGVPLALYRDRHALFETPSGDAPDARGAARRPAHPTQLGRALAELGITSIAARSPQAKGRIERAWGTFQDRLVSSCGWPVPATIGGRQPGPRRGSCRASTGASPSRRPTRSRPGGRCRAGSGLEPVCCLKYRRVVASDTPSGPGRRSSSCRPARAGAAMPADGSSSSSASTAGSSSGTASRSPRPAAPPTRSSSGPSTRLAPIRAPSHRVSAPWRSQGPVIPGGTSSRGRSSTSGSRRRDCQDHGPGDQTESLTCDTGAGGRRAIHALVPARPARRGASRRVRSPHHGDPPRSPRRLLEPVRGQARAGASPGRWHDLPLDVRRGPASEPHRRVAPPSSGPQPGRSRAHLVTIDASLARGLLRLDHRAADLRATRRTHEPGRDHQHRRGIGRGRASCSAPAAMRPTRARWVSRPSRPRRSRRCPRIPTTRSRPTGRRRSTPGSGRDRTRSTSSCSPAARPAAPRA